MDENLENDGVEFTPDVGSITEDQNALAVECQRLATYAQWMAREGFAGTMIVENYINMHLMRAELVALSKVICSKGINEVRLGPLTSDAELTAATVEELRKHIMLQQIGRKIIITPDGVVGDQNR